MARPPGSGAGYQQALKTVGKNLPIEKLAEKNVLSALNTLIDIMNDADTPAAVRVGVSKYIIEIHAKIAKAHGSNPIPANFIVDKVVSVDEEPGTDGKVLNMTMSGG